MKQVLNFFRKAGCCALVLLLALAGESRAQGLYKNYNDPEHPNLTGYRVEELPGGNYRLLANSDPNNNTDFALRHAVLDINTSGEIVDSMYRELQYRSFRLKDGTFLQPAIGFFIPDTIIPFLRLTPALDTLWSFDLNIPFGMVEWVHADVDTGGNVWVGGVWFDDVPNTALILLKIGPGGQLLWQKEVTYPINLETSVHFEFTKEQGCLLKFDASPGVVVWKLDAAGAPVWQKNFTLHTGHIDLAPSKDERYLLADYTEIISIDSAGNVLFQFDLKTLASAFPFPLGATATADGGWVITGGNSNDFSALKLSATGEVQWLKNYDLSIYFPQGGVETANGDLLWTGPGPFLVRMDSNGVIFKNHLSGRLAYDQNLDCAVQNPEAGIPGWILKLENAGAIQYTVSDPDGYYYFPQVDTGLQTLTPVTQNYLWEACAPSFLGYIHPDSSDSTFPLDAPVQSLFDCPVLTVDLATPRLRRCFNNNYALQCCNYGNQPAHDAYVELWLPPHLLLKSASHPYTQNGLQLIFQLGALEPFECRDIQLIVKPDCDSTEIGQALCVSAHVYPDTLCGTTPGWSGALIEVSAACDADSVRFDIRNTGNSPMGGALDFVVIDDQVMTLQGDFNLAAGESHPVVLPADGSTWRLLAEQVPGAPGAAAPSVALQNCTPTFSATAGSFAIQWPNENGSPFWERDCHEVIASYDPNAKQAAPAGVDAEHWIKPNTPIEYLIDFQNTGNDTAFTVVLRDTIGADLRIETIRPGAGSHPYTWHFEAGGILVFRFDNILLPDSSTNEEDSHGFVQFQVEQAPDLPDGTVLENRAGIYFDFNDPIVTNTTYHTVGREFLPTVGLYNPSQAPVSSLLVYPTPAHHSVFVSSENENRVGGFFTLFDALGQVRRRGILSSNVLEIKRNDLPAGIYWVRWEAAGGGVIIGKIVWH